MEDAPMDTQINDTLLAILSKLETDSEKVDDIIEDVWQLSYPRDGTRAVLGIGTTTIDFDAGTILDADGLVTEMSSSLRKHGKAFMQSVAMTADHDIVIQFDLHDRMPLRAHGWYHGTQQEFTRIRITTTQATSVFVAVSTSPAPMDMQDRYIDKQDGVLADWTAVAQNTIAKSGECDLSDAYGGILHIQSALDSTTAHTGTKFIVQTSPTESGNEDWQNLTEFVALIGTAVSDAIEDNPLAAGSTSIALTAHGLTVEGKLLFIEDATLVNSEIVLEASQSLNAVVTLDGVANAHALNTVIFNIAMTQDVSIPQSVRRARVVVDNTYDDNGSSVNYKARVTKVTGL